MTKFTLRIPETLIDFEVDDATLAEAKNNGKTFLADRIWEAGQSALTNWGEDHTDLEVYDQYGMQVDLDPEGYYSMPEVKGPGNTN